MSTYIAEVKDPKNPGKKFSPLAWFYPEKTEEMKKDVLKPVRRTCVTATLSHRDVRCKDGAGGKMVGAGPHLTSRGTFEPYKATNIKGSKKGKRKLMQQAADSMASSIACCDKAFNFFKGTNLQCCSRSRLSCFPARCFTRLESRLLDRALGSALGWLRARCVACVWMGMLF